MTKPSQSRYYRRMKDKMPAFIAALDNIGVMVRKAGPLDEKTIQLVQLAACAGIRSEGAVHSHTRRALEAGATPADVRHALLCLTSTIGFPGVAAALTWADDELTDADGECNERQADGAVMGTVASS